VDGGAGGLGGSAGDAGSAGGAGTDASRKAAAAAAAAAAAKNGGGGAGGGGAASCNGPKPKNGDSGVSADKIAFAATTATEGVAKDFLADAQVGMQAVQRQMNAKGGVCGRLIDLTLQNDSWEPNAGRQAIQHFIACNCYFGLAVNPSSEGLRGAIDNGDIDQAQMPVVGTDGMLLDQYNKTPWVWPIATSTHSVMHIIADDAKARGAANVAIVSETNYRFGVEGRDAFVNEAKRLGLNVVKDLQMDTKNGVPATAPNEFVTACTNSRQFDKCDFVAVLLEPASGQTFASKGGLGDGAPDHHPAQGYGMPQPLFLNSFATDCGARCNGMTAWTSFYPPIGQFAPAVGTYVNDVKAVKASTDITNPEVEGAYQGMRLLVQALTQLGANPTRAALRQVLDSTTLDTGLAPPLKFSAGNHFAAISAQGYDAVYNGNSFTGWRPNGKGFLNDNNVKQDLTG
jgi:ABC-type branched-subunit amino acid transport system substrate-binding protein